VTRYWAVRTDTRNNTDYIWRELQEGRLRQGWSRRSDEDLEVIEELRRLGGRLTLGQQEAWRRNRRLLSSQPGGVSVGDFVVLPHLPGRGMATLARVTGPYRFSIDDGRNWMGKPDFGNILPVQISSVPISRYDPALTDDLRRRLRPRMPMWSLDPVGSEIEDLVRDHPLSR
jgi:hypothetical protein